MRALLVFALLSAGILMSAQSFYTTFNDHYFADYHTLKWGEIHPDDLSMEYYPLDSTAHAVVLDDQGKMKVLNGSRNWEWWLNRIIRIKVLDEVGVEQYGDVSIDYYHGDGLDEIHNIKAQTISPNGERHEVIRKEIYREKINDYWSRVTFSFPNVQKGAVLEYSYDHYSKRLMIPNEWAFRREIPVRSSYYSFACSLPIVYSYMMRGAENMEVVANEDGSQTMKLGDMSILVGDAQYWMRNGAAVKEEPYMTTPEDYYIKVRFQATESYSSYGTESFYSDWEETAKDLLNADRIGQRFTKKRNIDNLLDAASQQVPMTADRADILYGLQDYLSKEISWDDYIGIYASQSPDDAFKTHSGSVADIQYAGIALLQAYGFSAHPVLISTRENGSMITSFPFLDQFNYVLVYVELDQGAILMDFTDPLLSPGFVRPMALNRLGFVVHSDTPQWIGINMNPTTETVGFDLTISEDGTIAGEMNCRQKAYSARDDRNRLKDLDITEVWSDRLEFPHQFNNIELQNEADATLPLVFKSDIAVNDAVFLNDDYIYLSPVLYSSFTENPFNLEKRDYPVDFAYPIEEKTVYSYAIPEGYAIEELPEKLVIKLPNDGASFQYQARAQAGKISLLIMIKVNSTYFTPDQYPALRDLFDQAAQKMGEQIVLKKV